MINGILMKKTVICHDMIMRTKVYIFRACKGQNSNHALYVVVCVLAVLQEQQNDNILKQNEQ